MSVLLIDVTGAKPDRRRTAADVGPSVVGIGHMELAGILLGVTVRVANK